MNINNTTFLNGAKICLPVCEKEQNMIADLLKTIDSKIDFYQEQIENSETWKKGLLQKMFC